MKILLLGANGQLGSDILRLNKRRNTPFAILALTRKDLDLSNQAAIHNTLMSYDFNVLLNCTSYHNTDQVEANPTLAFAINAFAVKAMADVCHTKQARFMHISTDYVFSHSARPLSENDLPTPLNIYGASKLMGEALATTLHDDTLIFRVASLFGIAGASGKGGNFVETIIRHGKEKGHLRVIHDQIMSPTSTKDVAQMLFNTIEKQIPSGIYHAVNSGQASWYDFAKIIIEKANIRASIEPIEAKEYPSVAMRPSFSALNNHKLAQLIGHIRPFQLALDDYLEEKGHLNVPCEA
jgi:dTDP-4-dehydrorhamnose reductase